MKFITRLTYLIYYFRKIDFGKFIRNLNYSSKISGKSRIRLFADSIYSVFKYNISLTDYFHFRFFSLEDAERDEWAGTGFMYEYQLVMNPKGVRDVLENKICFLQHFKQFVKREFHSLDEIQANLLLADKLLANSSGRIVLKGSRGQAGAEVMVISCKEYSSASLIKQMKLKKFDLAEEFVIQHNLLMALSPAGLNTVRIFTQLLNEDVKFLGARLRISVNSPVDNMAAGNLAAPIDIDSGVVTGPGVYSDITKEGKSVHPVTGVAIIGFVVPFWKEVIELVKLAALNTPGNRSVGWDIAITNDGPELIEGNHNWCKLLWQLPVGKGLKKDLEGFS